MTCLRGAESGRLAATRAPDHVQPDLAAAYRQGQEPLSAAFTEPGALDQAVSTGGASGIGRFQAVRLWPPRGTGGTPRFPLNM